MSNWYDLEQYRQQELDYCLKLAAGPSETTSLFYAQYGLALSYHQFHQDAVNLVAECKHNPLCQGIAEIVESMAAGGIPPSDLEYPVLLEPMASDAIHSYMVAKARGLHKTYKILEIDQAKKLIGDINILNGLYEEADGYLTAVTLPEVARQENITKDLDLLSQATTELQNSTRPREKSLNRVRRQQSAFSYSGRDPADLP